MKYLITFSFILLCIYSNAQDSINQLDSRGKKNGVWIEYLDSAKWEVVNDSSIASFGRYTYYDHGMNIFTETTNTRRRLEKADSLSLNNNDIFLNGEYKWYDNKDRLITDDYYINGERVWLKSYTWGLFNSKKTGKQMHEFYDMRKKYKDQNHTAYYELYNGKGKKKIYYLRKGSQGWNLYKE